MSSAWLVTLSDYDECAHLGLFSTYELALRRLELLNAEAAADLEAHAATLTGREWAHARREWLAKAKYIRKHGDFKFQLEELELESD